MKTLRKIESVVLNTVFTILEEMFVIFGTAYLVEEIIWNYEILVFWIIVIPYLYVKTRDLVFKLRTIIKGN